MKKNKLMTFGGAAALVLAIFVGCSGNAGEKEYSKAIKAWEKGDLVQARALFEKSTGRLSGNARKSEAYNELGLVLWELDEPQAAAAAFNEACTLSDSITPAWLNLALARFHSDDLKGAGEAISIYLGQYPDRPAALALQSLIAAQRRDWNASSRLIARAAAQTPTDPATRNIMALAELNGGQNSDRIIARLQKVAADAPDYAPALYNLAAIYDQWRQDPATARRYYEAYLQKAGESGSHSQRAREAIARLSGSAAGPAPAVDTEQAVQYMTEGARLHAAKRYAEAVAEFRKAVRINPNLKNAYYNMGLSFYSQGQYDDAVQACRSAVNLDPAFSDARYMLALSYVQQRKWAYAAREARELAKTDAKRGSELLAYIEKAAN